MLPKRTLGNTNLKVPVITLGGNVFGWTVNEADSFHLLDRAFDLGLTFIDTADTYSIWVSGNHGGDSETILGNWFAKTGKRKDVILATKVGKDMGGSKKGLSAQYIQQAAEDSLRRLQTDYIDIYFSHADDPATPLDETLSAYDRLIRDGKVRIVGASNYSGARLREALETSGRNQLPRYQVLQPHYNLLERREYESDLAPVVDQYKLGVTPYFALASGFLTGKYRKASDAVGKARSGGVQKYINDRGFAVLDAVESVAKVLHSTPAAVALAWLIQQPTVTSAIASATTPQHLDDLVAAANLELDPASVDKLSAVSATPAPVSA